MEYLYELITAFFTPHGNCILALPPLLLAALIGAGAGVVKNKSEQDAADKERKYQAETARWSPWTGMTSKSVKDPSLAGNVIGGALSGMAVGQGMGGGTSAAGAVPATSSVEGMGPVASGSSYGSMLNKQAVNQAAASPSLFGDSMTSDMVAQPEDYAANSKGSSYGGMTNSKAKRLNYFDI